MKTMIVLISFIPLACLGQTRWKPFGGIHAAMDGGGYYVGPSFQIGTDYKLKNRSAVLSSYLHYFSAGLSSNNTGGSFENGKYRSAIFALLIQKHLSKYDQQGLFLGAGIALQRIAENYKSDVEERHNKELFPLGTMRFGYLFPIGAKHLTVELNAAGPHRRIPVTTPYFTEEVDILTQLSLGVRIIF